METRRTGRATSSTATAAGPTPASWKLALKITAAILFIVLAIGAGAGLALTGRFLEAKNPLDLIKKVQGIQTAIVDPKEYFPGRDRITVLCLGLDRNIVRSKDPKVNGMPTWKDARSDVMMIASLDLASQTVSILSVPRDTRVKLPRRRSFSKINEAHSRGGIPYTRETVEEFLGIEIDHHVVIKQEAIQAVVDALGGVPMEVEKDMDYDDNWGQLHIHLKEGPQRLNGEQVVGYMRFRHDAEGDFGRIRRQQQVIQSLSEQVKDPKVVTKALGLIDAIKKYIQTDLTPHQQLALAHMFHKVQVGNVRMVAMPVADTDTIDGISYVIPDDDKKEAAVDWIIRGNPDAMNKLIRVELRNASGEPEVYQKIYRYLRNQGFEAWRAGRASEQASTTRIVQRTNLSGSGRRLLEVLGVGGGTIEKEKGHGADVTLYVGKDLAESPLLEVAEGLPELPDYRPTATRRRRERRARRDYDAVPVSVRSVDEGESSAGGGEGESPTPEPSLEVPGAADPAPPTPDAPGSEPGSGGGETTPSSSGGTSSGTGSAGGTESSGGSTSEGAPSESR